MTSKGSRWVALLLCFFIGVSFGGAQSHTRVTRPVSAGVVGWPSPVKPPTPAPTPQSDTVQLMSGVSQSGSIPPAIQERICFLGETQYAIQFPGGAAGLRIEVLADADVEFCVRRNERVTQEGGSTRADSFFAASNGFGSISIPFVGRLLEAGVYFIAVLNCKTTQTANFVLTATIFGPADEDTVPLSRGIAVVGSIPGASPNSCVLGRTQYTFPASGLVSCNNEHVVGVSLVGTRNVDLFIRFEERVVMANGNVVADRASQSPREVENLGFGPADRDGTFFIAVTNCSPDAADFSIGISVIEVSEAPAAAVVTKCSLKRDPSGAFYLVVNGHNFQAGAVVTVGGVAPRRIRFKRPEDGAGFSFPFAKLVLRGEVCKGLPGQILITNPETDKRCFQPFICNKQCPN